MPEVVEEPAIYQGDISRFLFGNFEGRPTEPKTDSSLARYMKSPIVQKLRR
jgi:hypothetical protein